MYNLRVLLLREQKRLERIQEKVIDNLKDVPPGTLRVSCGKIGLNIIIVCQMERKMGNIFPSQRKI